MLRFRFETVLITSIIPYPPRAVKRGNGKNSFQIPKLLDNIEREFSRISAACLTQARFCDKMKVTQQKTSSIAEEFI
jgi:hypothetical protein